MSDRQQVTKESLTRFKRDVVGACPSLVTLSEKRVVRTIPDGVFARAFQDTFDGDPKLARNILYNRFDLIDSGPAEREVEQIATLIPSAKIIADTIESGYPLLQISDIDNDGDFTQAEAMEMKRITGHDFFIQPKDYNPSNHGFGIEQIEEWMQDNSIEKNDNFLVLVTDLGTNQADTQKEFLEKFPKANLIIIDHHKPDADVYVSPNLERSKLVSPYVKGSMELSLRAGGGVSAGYLTYNVFKCTLEELNRRGFISLSEDELSKRITPLKNMGKAANLADRVSCKTTLKPLHEKEIEKVLTVTSLTNKGKSIIKWLPEEQIENIKSLESLVGAEAKNGLLDLRVKMLKHNHYAKALYEVLPLILSTEDKKAKISIPAEVGKAIDKSTIESSADRSYVSLVKSYLLNFYYEDQFEGGLKSSWLSLTEKLLNDIGKTEALVLEKIRDYQLVSEISEDYAMITQPASPEIGKVFTNKQMSKAYHSMSKPVNFSATKVNAGEIILSYKSEISISEILDDARKVFMGLGIKSRGHDNVGAITMSVPQGTNPYQMMELFVSIASKSAKKIMDSKPVQDAFEVKPIHLILIKEILKKMRVDIEDSTAPMMVMRIAPNMTFEDKYTLEKQPVSKLVEKKEWETTVEPLDYSMSSSLILPNQALKAIANDNFEGGLGIQLLPNGTYIANKVITGAQLKLLNVPVLKIPLEREREEMKKEYLARFASEDLPLVRVPRKVGMEALKFTGNGKAVFENTEALALGLMHKTGATKHAVLDVEAFEGGDAACYELGITVQTHKKGSGTIIPKDEFSLLTKKKANQITNFRKIDDDNYIFNERLETSIFSMVIKSDGGVTYRIPLKSQNLTNMDQDYVEEVGMTSEEAENKLLACFKDDEDKCIIQAHNLPYDNNIVRVNFPRFHEKMNKFIHLDTAPLAKNNQIAYTNVRVNLIDGDEYFNAEHKGYNLSTLMETKSSFDFPSIKGGTVLQVRGDVVQKVNLNTRITTKLKISRDDLAASLRGNMGPVKNPRYSISKVLKMATVIDLIGHRPLKKVKEIPFNSYGQSELDEKLWKHFQNNYAYDMTPAQNVAHFSVLPDVQDFLSREFSVPSGGIDGALLVEARGLAIGEKNDPLGKPRSKKAQEAYEKNMMSFSMSDVLHANAISFVLNNNENAERYARSWVYELVLGHYEPTTAHVPKGVISGVSEMTGVDSDVISYAYSDTHEYKVFRDLDTLFVEEVHSNGGLKGDMYQESHSTSHLLEAKLRNPFLTGEFAIRHGINPKQKTIDAMVVQAASDTLKQVVRLTSEKLLNHDSVNNYTARQLDNFSVDGISIAANRGGIPKMKCKTLSDSDSVVHIELPNFDVNEWRAMPTEERQEIEAELEKAVTVIILANSRGKNSLDPESKALIERFLAKPELTESLKAVKERFGVLVPTRREDAIKKMMKAGTEAILGQAPLKFPINKELNNDDLAVVRDSLIAGIEALNKQQNFESYIDVDELTSAIKVQEAHYLGFQHVRETGEGKTDFDGYEPLAGTVKAQQTIMIKALGNVLQSFEDACPDLASGVLNTKIDPIKFLLESPLVLEFMKSENELGPKISNEIDKPKEDINEVESEPVSKPRR